MKKYTLCLILAFSIGLSGYSQNVDRLLLKASQNENTEKVKISGLMMSLGKKFGSMNDMPLAKGVKSMEVYTLSCSATDLKKDFVELFNNAKDENGYETLIFAKDKDEGVRIMVKKEKDTIKDIILLCMDKDEPTIIKFSGKMKEKDIAELMNKYDK